jgi:tripartite-type tricarboxylate transporter receptor subunit TctC
VREGLPATSVKELIALAKQRPGKLTFASAGTGSIVQMAGELFKYHAGIDIVHVPFKGGTPATLSLLTGEVDILVNDLSTILTHIKSGKLRALAAAHTQRLPPLPDVPTFAEAGLPGVVSSTWWALAVPAKTPAAVRAKLVAAQKIIVARPDYVARLTELAMQPLNLTPEQTNAVIKLEIEKWRKVAAAANITAQ